MRFWLTWCDISKKRPKDGRGWGESFSWLACVQTFHFKAPRLMWKSSSCQQRHWQFHPLCQVKGDPTEWYLSRAGWQETSVLVWVDPILTESWKGRIAKHQRLWGQWGAPWHSGGWVSFLFLLNFFALLRGDNLSTPHLPPSLWTRDMRQLKVGGQAVGQTGQIPDQVQDTMYRMCWGL